MFYILYYSIILVAVEFFIPLLIISIAYIRISYHLWGNKTPGIAQDLRDQALLVNKKKVSWIKLLQGEVHKVLNSNNWNRISNIFFYFIISDHQDAIDSSDFICCVLDALANMADDTFHRTERKWVSIYSIKNLALNDI